MFLGWLCVVARTALSDCRRRRLSFWSLLQRRHADPSDAVETSESAEPADDHLQLALDTALAQLTATDRSLLERKYFSGTDVRTLAVQLGVTPKAVESRLTRARAELRRLLVTALKRHE